ncbi:hypothetical protein [Marinococcus sp. PL1-022]|uniref:hypothetical protein n=1 Tax=Marinococcus sp. PL1-022 TaxID=3095363 RepID=UPI0029C2034B|nr:hypothetical protein [Marinococcus sp. PL1-022]MDX6153914.1 hypothetical protein [Marinococcus sp. PL1-022]
MSNRDRYFPDVQGSLLPEVGWKVTPSGQAPKLDRIEKRRKPFSGIGSGGALDKGAFSLYQRSEETGCRWLPELDIEKLRFFRAVRLKSLHPVATSN